MEVEDEDLICIHRSEEKNHYFFADIKSGESLTDDFDSKYDGLQELIDLFEDNEITSVACLTAIEELMRHHVPNVSGNLNVKQRIAEESIFLMQIEGFRDHVTGVALFEEDDSKPFFQDYYDSGKIMIYFLSTQEIDGEEVEVTAYIEFTSKDTVFKWLDGDAKKDCTSEQIKEIRGQVRASLSIPDSQVLLFNELVDLNLN